MRSAVISRRGFLASALLGAPALRSLPIAGADRNSRLRQAIADLERKYGGRLGVAIVDTATHTRIDHRGDERFALCSTFKLLAAAFVLARVDRSDERLSRRITYTKEYLVAYSPATEQHVGDGMTVGDLCEAAITLGDNTAANLLLDSFGGPPALTAFIRSLGDTITRLDRREPSLNDVEAGDPRDTTTPLSMLGLVQTLVLGSVLSVSSRDQLIAWLVATTTGDARLRAGIPQGWRVGDKTGSGARNATNDVAIVWPPGRAPIFVTAYYAEAEASDDERNAVLAQVGRIAASM